MPGSHKITAHTLVKNEARWIWFALNSVLDYVDEIMVWDTGSTDSTVEIVKTIDSPKINLRQIGPVDAPGHTAARQKMLEETDSDWIMILDGDEIWYKDSLVSCINASTHDTHLTGLISPFINLVGDVYHFQKPARSRYRIGEYEGPYNIRFINRRIPGLHVAKPHGGQEYRSGGNIAVQNFSPDRLLLVDKPYLHTTHLERSGSRDTDAQTLKRDFKYRHELGKKLPTGFIFPEVFYLPRPKIVPNPWTRRSPEYVLKSLVFDLGRLIIPKKSQNGY